MGLAGFMCVASCGGRAARRSAAAVAVAVNAGPMSPQERVVALLPPGAQLVLEFDMARLRAHPVLGDLWAKVSENLKTYGAPAALAAASTASFEQAFDPVLQADFVVVGAYDIGTSAARTVTLSRGQTPPPGAVLVGDGVYAVGPDGMLGELMVRGAAPLALSPSFRSLRQRPMPQGATGAIVRLTAQWPKTSAIDLQGYLGTSVVPTDVSLWFDVVDDAAVVVHARIDDELARATFVSSLQTGAANLAKAPWARALGLAPSLAGVKVGQRDGEVVLVLLIGPKRLSQVALALRAGLADWQTSLKTPAKPPPPPPSAP